MSPRRTSLYAVLHAPITLHSPIACRHVVPVELDEGQRLIATVIGIEGATGLALEASVGVKFGYEGEVPVTRCVLVGPE